MRLTEQTKISEKHLNNNDDICKLIDVVYAMGRTIEERKGLKRNKKRKEKRKNRDGQK